MIRGGDLCKNVPQFKLNQPNASIFSGYGSGASGGDIWSMSHQFGVGVEFGGVNSPDAQDFISANMDGGNGGDYSAYWSGVLSYVSDLAASPDLADGNYSISMNQLSTGARQENAYSLGLINSQVTFGGGFSYTQAGASYGISNSILNGPRFASLQQGTPDYSIEDDANSGGLFSPFNKTYKDSYFGMMPEYEDADEEKNYKGGSAADVGGFTYRANVSVYQSEGSWFLTVSMMTQQPDFDGKWSITGFSSLMVNGQQISAQSAALPSGSYFSDAEWNYVGSSTYPLGNITGGNVTLSIGGGWAINNGSGSWVPTVFSPSGFNHTVQISNQNGNAGAFH